MDIYVVNYIGITGALALYEKDKDFFQKRFPGFFISQIEALKNLCGKAADTKLCLEKNTKCVYITQIVTGGIFRSLWEGAEALNTGCEIFLNEIPLKQEVVEITELSQENPYEINSDESLLFFADAEDFGKDFEEELKFLEKENLIIKKIGHTTLSKDRVLIKGENKRFLTPAKRQEKDIENRKKKETVL